MKYCYLIIAVTIVFFTSCKKPKIESVNTNNSKDSLTYQPSVSGSRWTYERVVAGITSTTYNYERLNKDTLAWGSTYNVFSNDGDNYGNQYFRNSNGKYYNLLSASTNKPEILILDTTKNIGESWLGGVNGSDTYTYTMKQKISSYQLDGFTFRNVLVVHAERTNGSGSSTLSGDTYYAQGVGQVQTIGTVSGVGINIKLKTVDLK